MKVEALLQELTDLTENHMKEARFLKGLPMQTLNYKSNSESWSILECIAHLNRYGNFYIPEIRQRIKKSKHKESKIFKTGVIGNYFAKNMLPKENMSKMKTFRAMNPNNSSLDSGVLNEFIDQQEQIVALLKSARKTNLSKVRTSISISKLVKLRLGDTFRVVIYHNFRHIIQAKKTLENSTDQ